MDLNGDSFRGVHDGCMAHRFKNIDRNTAMLLPPDLRDWVAEDDLVHFVISAVERLPLSAFAVKAINGMRKRLT